MDSCLTQQIPVSLPPWRKYSGVPKIPGYTNVTSLTPILEKFFGKMPDSEGQIHSDNLFGKLHFFEGSGQCDVETVARKKKTAFCKVTHLLDPVRTIQAYYSDPVKGDARRQKKLKNPMNQAYVDSLACYLLGQLRERNISPHFCLFYGAFQADAEKYRYNITPEFESYRKYRVFWERRRAGMFSLILQREQVEDDEEEEEDLNDHWLVNTPKSTLRSTEFKYTTPRSSPCHSKGGSVKGGDDSEDEILDVDQPLGDATLELQSVGSLPSVEEEEKEEEETSEETEEDTIEVYIELKDYPVMLMFQENMEGPLDDLLEDDGLLTGAEPNTPEWEARWIAWTFQVIAALCAAQGVYGMTHNDLHTNNIVWKDTSETWLWYKSRDGTTWRVPTYGKIFCIIDFGRAIFRVQDTWFISDDYERGGDAEGQYTFDHLKKSGREVVYPNPSFDLCRYAVSILEALYPEQPTEKLDGAVLSEEGDWRVMETESPFWNLIWSWLIDDHGRNVLREADGEERFPDFDLYIHIAEHVHNAKPQDQIHKEIFKSFLIDPKNVGDWETVYPLFC